MIEPGEIYFVSAGKNVATGCEIWPERPGIVISSKRAVACSGTVNIIYLTSSERPKDFGITIPESSFTASIKKYTIHTALCGQIHTVDKSRLGNYLGRIPNPVLKEIQTALMLANFDGKITKPARPRKNTKSKGKTKNGTAA